MKHFTNISKLAATAALAFAAFVLAAKAEAKESFDLTKLRLTENSFTAILGDDAQRMEIVFLTMKKKSKNEYEVTGKSKVKTNICDFKGTMQVQKEENFYGEADGPDEVDGQVTGTYLFSEDKNQKGTGVFKGEFKIAWANRENGIGFASLVKEDAVSFIGSWTSYATGKSKKANWCDEGWCGPGYANDGQELMVDEKYRSKGWGDYIDIWYEATRERGLKERREIKENWWKKK
jgi:hypothetical protein